MHSLCLYVLYSLWKFSIQGSLKWHIEIRLCEKLITAFGDVAFLRTATYTNSDLSPVGYEKTSLRKVLWESNKVHTKY